MFKQRVPIVFQANSMGKAGKQWSYRYKYRMKSAEVRTDKPTTRGITGIFKEMQQPALVERVALSLTMKHS